MLRTSKEQHVLNCFEAYLAESYIKSFNFRISLRLEVLLFWQKYPKPLSSAELVHYRQVIGDFAETFIIRMSPASNNCG